MYKTNIPSQNLERTSVKNSLTGPSQLWSFTDGDSDGDDYEDDGEEDSKGQNTDDNVVDDDDGNDTDSDNTNNGDDDNITLGMPETQKKSEYGLEELYVFYYSFLSNNLPFYVPPRFFFFPLPLSKSK